MQLETRIVMSGRNEGENDIRVVNILREYLPSLGEYEELYRNFHQYPELSKLEIETSKKIISQLQRWEFTIHDKIGGHGLVAVLENGNGKTVLLRADMDALPVEEKTQLSYASKKRMVDFEGVDYPVMHACGHDVHITTLLAAAETLFKSRSKWSGTLLCLFQPAEEKASGALDMVNSGVYDRIGHIPDILLGGHVFNYPAGFVGMRSGPILGGCDGFKVTVFGTGGHASTPELTVDPVLLASHIVVRLQGIVSREVAPKDRAVLTVGSIQGGDTENIIPDHAIIRINIRTFDKEVRGNIISSMKRIIDAECVASNTPKPALIEPTFEVPITINDRHATKMLSASFQAVFGTQFNGDVNAISGSEDFSHLAKSIGKPYCFWLYGSADPDLFDDNMKANGRLSPNVPGNHSPFFSPVIERTLKPAVESYVAAALTWL